ncbi:MAG TPA: helix-turn-helix domain-containing protein [Steroidobacteraceae bacterium]|nr:helix-turn-helix domain-containing protein [Steroidobacteraceae bacterium]
MKSSHSQLEASRRRAANAQALNGFRDDLTRKYGAHDACFTAEQDFSGRLEIRRLGPFEVGIASGSGVRWGRIGNCLDDAWHDRFFLLHQHLGRTVLRHLGREAALKPRDCALVDAFGPCNFELVQQGVLVCFSFPRALLGRLRLDRASPFGHTIDGSIGVGRVLSAMLLSLSGSDQEYDQTDEAVICDVITSLLERGFRVREAHQPSTREEEMLARLKRWVLLHIAEADITPGTLAEACNISRRQLYRLFELQETTPAAWVWHLRLKKAHEELLACPHRPITEIAFAVGFNDAAHFSRTFRKHFGFPPIALRVGGVDSAVPRQQP